MKDEKWRILVLSVLVVVLSGESALVYFEMLKCYYVCVCVCVCVCVFAVMRFFVFCEKYKPANERQDRKNGQNWRWPRHTTPWTCPGSNVPHCERWAWASEYCSTAALEIEKILNWSFLQFSQWSLSHSTGIVHSDVMGKCGGPQKEKWSTRFSYKKLSERVKG